MVLTYSCLDTLNEQSRTTSKKPLERSPNPKLTQTEAPYPAQNHELLKRHSSNNNPTKTKKYQTENNIQSGGTHQRAVSNVVFLDVSPWFRVVWIFSFSSQIKRKILCRFERDGRRGFVLIFFTVRDSKLIPCTSHVLSLSFVLFRKDCTELESSSNSPSS